MKKLLFVSFVDFGRYESGSSVRPQQMEKAFSDLGYEMKLLSGAQNRRKERAQRVAEIILWLDGNRPDFCYIESPSGPIFTGADHRLLKTLKRLQIPTAYFYRDAFWLFPDWWGVSGLKRAILTAMYRRDLRFIKSCCDIVYFPSQSMAEHFDFQDKRPLPPAGENRIIRRDTLFHNVIYVGGLSERYGTPILLKAFDLLNRQFGQNISLTLVCRERERSIIGDRYLNQPWLHVETASGQEQLAPFYTRADLGIYAGKRDLYMDFAVPVKLFEYISYGLPVVTTDCVEAKRIVEQGGFGAVCQDNADSMACAILELYRDPERLKRYAENAAYQLQSRNLWIHRAKQVGEDLETYRGKGQEPL